MSEERDYISRTIATVRNHRDSENCWPQWANVFADEIERLRAERVQTVELLTAAYTYIDYHVQPSDALTDGFDVWAWCQAVEKALGLPNPEERTTSAPPMPRPKGSALLARGRDEGGRRG